MDFFCSCCCVHVSLMITNVENGKRQRILNGNVEMCKKEENQIWVEAYFACSKRQVGRQIGRQIGRYAGRLIGRYICKQVDRQVDRQIGRQIGRYVGRQVGRQVGRWIDRQVGKQVDMQVGSQIGRYVSRQVGRWIDRQVNRYADRQVGTQVGRYAGRQVTNLFHYCMRIRVIRRRLTPCWCVQCLICQCGPEETFTSNILCLKFFFQ